MYIRINTLTDSYYDFDGNPFADGMPAIPYNNTEIVYVQLYTATPNAGTSTVDVSTWTKDNRYASSSGIGALLSADNNFKHKIKGTLKTALTAGAIVAIEVTTTESATNIPAAGQIKLYSADGTIEAVDYTARTAITGGYSFTVSATIAKSYTTGLQVDIPEALYAQAALDAVNSDPATGLFVFNFTASSPKLENKLEYSDTREADDLKGLELYVFQTINSVVKDVGRWLCTSFSIPNGLADTDQTSTISTEQENQMAAVVDALLAQGFEVATQTVDGVKSFRFRSAAGAGTWSEWISLISPYNAAIQYSIDGSTLWHSTFTTGDIYMRVSSDSGDTYSSAMKFIGDDGTDGLNTYSGSGVPSSSLGINDETYLDADTGDLYKKSSGSWSVTGSMKGIQGTSFTVNASGLLSEKSTYDTEAKGFAFLATDTGDLYIKNSATSGDWSAAIPFVGPQGDSAYLYIAYASNSSGDNRSYTQSSTLVFRAEISTNSATPPALSAFDAATWIKYREVRAQVNVTSSQAVVAGVDYNIDPTSAAVTLTLPASPATTDEAIGFCASNIANTVTIARNGNNIRNSDNTAVAEDMVIDEANMYIQLAYDGTAWFVKDPLSGLIATPTASQVVVDASGFDGNLSTADDTVQKALATIDAMTAESGASPNLGSYVADSMPMSYNETLWSVSTRPAYDASIIAAGLMRFDYSTAEYVGQFVLDPIPTGSTNLTVKIKARPYSTAATGTNMGWSMKYIIIRDNTATTSIATQILGSTAFQTSNAGDTTGDYSVALSTLSVTTGDVIVCLIYPDTTVTTPKQTDWMVLEVNFGVN